MCFEMRADVVIQAAGVGKCYQIYEKPAHRLLQGLVGDSRRFYREFWALRDIGFEVRRGETLGIVGRNGSGKSTLLQLIAGTLTPTTGEIQVRGRVAALLELGSGFNSDFTGRENVYLNASILGLSKDQIDERYDAITEFAAIGDFIDQPIRNYSSGMVMRLAFSVIAHVDADILIIDEALSVGDAFFTQKCMRFLREFKERGTLLFVSHDGASITGMCDRTIWLDQGAMRQQGEPKVVMNAYLEAFIADREGRTGSAGNEGPKSVEAMSRIRDKRLDLVNLSTLRNDIEVVEFVPSKGFGEGQARITDVALCDAEGKMLPTIIGGEIVSLEITAVVSVDVDNMIAGFYFKDKLGQLLFGDNTETARQGAPLALRAGEQFSARFVFEMPRLQQGDYFITAGIASGTQQEHVIQHWMHEALALKSLSRSLPVGIIGLPMHEIALERLS